MDQAKPTRFTCPSCHGVLFEIPEGHAARFRCHTGHGFTLRSLQHAQAEATDEAVWTAIRALQEKQLLLEALAEAHGHELGDGERERLLVMARETADQAERLRGLVEETPPNES